MQPCLSNYTIPRVVQLKTIVLYSPPTTPHGRFENAFPAWRENFPRSFKFDVEVDPRVPTFGGNLGYY